MQIRYVHFPSLHLSPRNTIGKILFSQLLAGCLMKFSNIIEQQSVSRLKMHIYLNKISKNFATITRNRNPDAYHLYPKLN